MASMIDRMARADFNETYNPAHLTLDAAWIKNKDNIQDYYRNAMRAVLTAMREPTPAILNACGGDLEENYQHWTKCIDAALAEKPE